MEYLQFIEFCDKGYCLRNTFITNNCSKESKRRSCYNKYIKKMEQKMNDIMEDPLWTEVREELFQRDNNTCQLWKILSQEERVYILHNHFEDYSQLSKTLDPCHIVPRARSSKLYYDLDNLVLISRYFHSLLDTWKHPVYRTTITDQERIDWFNKAKGER